MKRWRISILIGVLTVALMAISVGSAGAAPKWPFTGAWTSIDAADESSQMLSIGGGESPHVMLYDHGASSCDESLTVAARGTGSAFSVTNLQLVVPLTVYCLDGSGTVQGPLEVTFTYDSVTDTITDDLEFPTTWFRRGS